MLPRRPILGHPTTQPPSPPREDVPTLWLHVPSPCVALGSLQITSPDPAMEACHTQLSSCFRSTPDSSGCAGTWAHPGTTSESPVTQGLVHSKGYQVFLWKDNRTEGRVRRGGGTAHFCPALGASDAPWAAAGHTMVPNVTSSCELIPWLLLTLQEPPYHFLLPKTAEAPQVGL